MITWSPAHTNLNLLKRQKKERQNALSFGS